MGENNGAAQCALYYVGPAPAEGDRLLRARLYQNAQYGCLGGARHLPHIAKAVGAMFALQPTSALAHRRIFTRDARRRRLPMAQLVDLSAVAVVEMLPCAVELNLLDAAAGDAIEQRRREALFDEQVGRKNAAHEWTRL